MYLHLLSVNVKIDKRLFTDLISNLSAAEIKIVFMLPYLKKREKLFFTCFYEKDKMMLANPQHHGSMYLRLQTAIIFLGITNNCR